MEQADPFAQFPEQIRANLGPMSPSYIRVPNRFAIHGAVPFQLSQSVLTYINNRSIAILQGSITPELITHSSIIATPIYARVLHGAPTVPTGKIFIRFEEGIRAQDKHEALEAVGYRIFDIPAYAPHTVWVCANPDRIDVSLSNMSKLLSIPDISNIEPQMLAALHYRQDQGEEHDA